MGIHLADPRGHANKTQGEIALALGVKQPTVAGMESLGRDLKISSLKRYVEATGGKLRIGVEFPDGASKTSVVSWESGEKKPGPAAVKLLNIVDRKGLDAVGCNDKHLQR